MAKYRERKSQNDSNSPVAASRQDYQDHGSNQAEQDNRDKKQKNPSVKAAIDQDILLEKEQQIRELQETVEILELKIAKLEQLIRLKDNKIQKLMGK
eukprot:CAMPEP_0173151752 /NCGR_PEP_ID=MMETSP1105-20130129/11790_1 /TAXON_ID=2985 /ORGANISM="Ochromonas sp., Strain BG-1" /LENGTH=96 /DNA_ID=CAMNT_0014067233 /DNA_START=357 /DNA_END=647 /DNA_ORIENTATION=+